MAITLPANVAPNELIASAWGNAVVSALEELDDEKVNLVGGTLTGSVLLDGGVIRAGITNGSQVQLVDTDGGYQAFVSFFGNATSITSLGTRTSSIGHQAVDDLSIRAEASGAELQLWANNDIVFLPGEVETFRIAGTVFPFGKTASNLGVAGVELYGLGNPAVGSVRSTLDVAGIQNVYCRHQSAADANTEAYIQFARTSGGTLIGAITQVSTTGVAYNTTSDERMKTVLRDLDDDEIADILRLIAPVVFEFDSAPGVEYVGFIAQQLAATWPTFVDVGIVTPSRGEFGDPDFVPWMVDLSKLVPLVVAGWQQLDRRLTVLEDA